MFRRLIAGNAELAACDELYPLLLARTDLYLLTLVRVHYNRLALEHVHTDH